MVVISRSFLLLFFKKEGLAFLFVARKAWMPACAGMTGLTDGLRA
jgi:hypothetical protein